MHVVFSNGSAVFSSDLSISADSVTKNACKRPIDSLDVEPTGHLLFVAPQNGWGARSWPVTRKAGRACYDNTAATSMVTRYCSLETSAWLKFLRSRRWCRTRTRCRIPPRSGCRRW